jgi:VWFA-related protein
MIRALLSVFLAVALCAPIVAGGQAPKEGSAGTIRVDTNLVIVDVVVTDANQNPVHNLTAADFGLREDGQAQTIKSFEEHTAGKQYAGNEAAKVHQAAPLQRVDPGVFTNDSPIPANGPLNIILLDKLNTPLADQAYCVDQLLEYINSAPAGTRIAILSLTSSQLFLLQGFTTDRELLRAALSSKNTTMRTSLFLEFDNAVRGDTGVIATGGGPKYRYRLQLTMQALNQLCRYLVQLPGRKNLLWLSTSFPISMLPMGTDNLFAHNQIAVYPITTHGLLVDPHWDVEAGGDGADTQALSDSVKSTGLSDAYNNWAATDLANPTGGKAFLTNDLKENMARAIEAGSNYYTLTYSPTSHDWNGRYRKIELQLARQGLTLAYRRGYYAIDPNAPGQPNRQNTHNTQPVPHSAMRTAMVRGSPEPAEIRFEASVRPSIADAELTLAQGNQGNPKVKGPYRRYSIHYFAHQRDIECPADRGGVRILAMWSLSPASTMQAAF